MVADRILILGFEDIAGARPSLKTSIEASTTAPQAYALLTKLGYEAVQLKQGEKLAAFVASNRLDGILIDTYYAESSLMDLIDFFRSNESTRSLPIIAAIDSPRELQNIKERKFPRLEALLKPIPVGIMASRLATHLRVRKTDGADSSRASLGDINANLRDINQRFAHEREEAKRIQQALLPQHLPISKNYEMAVAYKPLEDVGGDWYYFTQLDDGKLSFQVADITGHGISAAFIGSMTKLALKATNCSNPGKLLSGMNNLISPVLPEGRFVTMASFEYDPGTGRLCASYAGHPAALIIRNSGAEELKGAGFPLGFEEGFEYTDKETHLKPGDIVVAYTDGISEALNLSNEMFGSARIGQSLVNVAATDSAEHLLSKLLADLDHFREGRIIKDDVTIIVLKITN